MLLSPVLSRPIRSQSAHFLAMARSTSSCGCPPALAAVSASDFSDGDGTPSVAIQRASPLLAGSGTLPSLTSHSSAAAVARQLHSLPGSECFTRCPNVAYGSGGYHNATTIVSLPKAHHRHCRYYRSQRGSVSQHDSFESTGSAGSAAGQQLALPSAAAVRAVAGLPISAASAFFLQRSHSDAQELVDCRQRLRQQQSRGFQAPMGVAPKKRTVDNSQPAGSATGETAGAAAARQLDALHVQQLRRMHRQTSQRLNGFNADGLNSSLESNSGTAPYFFNVSTASAAGSAMANNGTAAPSTASLIRLRHCPLGHSDPQLYTLSAYSSVGGSPHTGHRHHQRSIGHALSGAIPSAGADGGLFGYAPVDGGAAGSVAAAAFAAGAGGSRRSFLSASPLTLGRLRKDSLLLNTPRTSIGGASPAGSAASAGSSGGGRRRHHHHGHGQPHGSPGGSLVDRRHSARRSIAGDASASAVAAFGRFRLRSSTGAGSLAGGPSTSVACVAPLRQPIALRAGTHQLAASAPTGGRGDNRRWSLASLPSSSGYGTPGSNSAFSSQYSSQEHLAEMLMDFQVGGHHFDSNDSYYDELIGVAGGSFFGFRPRSRSLISPMRLGFDGDGADSTAAPILASVYKERFPKAKAQMESRLQQFLAGNAPLSGFTSSTVIAAVALASMDGQDSCGGGSGPSRATSPMSTTVPRPTGFGGLCGELGSSGNGSIRGRAHSRSASPRPTSPLLPRPISPLAVGSATAFADGVVFQNVSPVSGTQLAPGGSAGDTSLSPTSSTFNLAGAGGELKFHPALAAATQLSRDVASNNSVGSTANESGTVSIIPVGQRSHRSSFMITAPGEQLSAGEAALLRLISNGATRFLHHQLCEIAADCLVKSREDLLTSAYFCQMSVRLDETLAEAELKVGPESYRYLVGLVRQMLMIVSRTARLLECLEFDPDEFYHLLEEAEGTVREQLGCGSARVPDLPQYIIGKLGLNKELLIDQPMEDELSRSQGPPESIVLAEDTSHGTFVEAAGLMDGAAIVRAAPREEDFDTIRLISNGAYGAVYLVRHRQTRQRFALKKMKKQTLILRNQVDQVYAERDILTFTDNPFVVCFYGSFETRQHLCMLMEYVEGGDCAALLKSAGTLPIELARLYAAETVLAIEYLHSCGIVHRDLKPDNLLITTMGHIKLTDFGLSKIGLMNRTTLVSEVCMGETHQFKDNQLCGTPEYIAPCVILRQGYGKPVDWWALGIILYEFLVGIVPFMGETSEELFANIINEEVEYPEGDEALEASAESLIRMLLEKNPVDRLGTAGGAAEVVSHPFFASLNFDSLLRQKAEFVPQLENDEDTSYFDSREDRYNHEADSADDDYTPMFWSFSTASPRHSIVGLEIPSSALAGLQALAESSGTTEPSDETSSLSTKPPTRRQSAFSAVRQQSPFSLAAENSLYTATDGRLQPASGCLDSKSVDTQPIPSAVILRRRFSAARHANLSTSSSGTTATGPPTANTGSSTDSSLDAGHFGAAMAAGGQPLPRLAISPCAELAARPAAPPQRRATMTVTASDTSIGGGYDASVASGSLNELSPVEETAAGSTYSISAMLQTSQPSSPHIIPATDVFTRSGRPAMDKRPSTVSHTLLTESAGDSVLLRVGGSSLPSRSNLIRVMIPQQPQGQSQGQPAPLSNDSSYYHSYGVGGSSGGQLSPSSCRSASSVSSLDGNAAPLASSSGGDATAPPRGRSASSVLPLGQQQSLPPPAILHPQQQQQQPSSSRHQQQTKTVKMKRGPQGYGFTIRSVRVYLSEVSEYYTIEHIVAAVRDDSPAYEAGLRADDLIIYVFGQPVHNLSHPQLMHRLLSAGNGELTLHVAPLNTTSIKAGEARRVVGKLLRKKPRRPGVSGTGGASGAAVSRRTGMEKKPRKVSALLRRLSGKRTAGDIVPGTSSQKQTFMPRSVSSQDGVLAVQPSAGAIRFGQYLTTADAMVNVPYAGGPISPARASPVPMASSSSSLRHHSSFKGVNCGGDGKSPPLSASAFHQKRLSDFGIGCSASSSSPMTSTTNSSLGSGDFLHLQPMSATISGHSHQSPLVASSKSAPLPPVQDDSSNSLSIYTITAERLVTPDPNARLTPSRPTTLVQTPPSPLSKTSTGATLPRVSSGFESASSVGLRQSKQSENTLSMPATSDQKLELRLSQ